MAMIVVGSKDTARIIVSSDFITVIVTMLNTDSGIETELNNYLSSQPEGTYEEWIRTLHPEAKENVLLEGLGGLIDPEFYAEDNHHRNIWNSHSANKRQQVPSTPVGSESSDDVEIFDLLGDKQTIISAAAVSPSTNVSPDVDLLSFD
jgi:hypothetical protein